MASRSKPLPRHRRSLLNRVARAVSYQKGTPLNMPLSERLAALRHGFRSSMYTFYDFKHNNPADYLPDTLFRETTNINGSFCQRILSDKLLFGQIVGDAFRVPEVLALLERGQLHTLTPGETLTGLLDARGGLIIKPVAGWQGTGILSVGVSASGELSVNGHAETLAGLEARLSGLDGYLVSERIVQDGYAHEIYPGSANSVRVVTMQDPAEDDRPFVAVAFHRFGSTTTGPVDNVSRGGLMTHVATDGVMGQALKFPRETGGKLSWCTHHPDTGAAIEGQAVPGWAELQARILQLVSDYPFFRHVGWDIIVAQGEAWLVEGNHNPSPVGQVFKPYLKDPQIRRFLEAYAVI